MRKSSKQAKRGDNHMMKKYVIEIFNGNEFSTPVPGRKYEKPNRLLFSRNSVKIIFNKFMSIKLPKFAMLNNLNFCTFREDSSFSELLPFNPIVILEYFHISVKIQ